MLSNKHFTITSVFLVIILCISLANVKSALADNGAPTEPPAATEAPTESPVVATESPVVATEPPVESTPILVEAAATPEPAQETAVETGDIPVAELLSEVADNTDLLVLDENGEPLPLGSQEAADIIVEADPMWCPEGVLPNGPGCTGNLTISALLALLQANVGGTFSQNGVIYFERSSVSIYTTACNFQV